jgi:H+/Cl- antiporter ClcA
LIAGSLRSWLRSVALEEATLLASLGKWTALAVLVGMLGGASTALFLRVLDGGIALAAAFPYAFVMLPLGFAASVLLVQWLAPQARGHGTEKIIEAVHMRWGRIPFLVAPVKLVATVLTISVGGSVGKEGPAAQIGAALASALASALWLRRDDRRKLVICGISAGFASVFGTPIAGAIFGVEVLVMGSLFYEVVYPSFIAGIVAYQTSIHLGSTYFHQTIGHVPVPGEGIFLQMVGTGIAIGVVAIVMIESLRVADLVAAAIRAPRWLVGAGGGVLLAGLAWLTSPRYLGLGIDTLEQAVTGAPVPVAAFALKIVFTAVSLASGGSGGIITPIFFVGSTAGSALAGIMGGDRALFASVGMVAMVAASANAPIAASIMALELFGSAVGPYAAIACVVSFLVVGHRSVYGSQLLGAAKSESIRVRSDIALDRGEAVVIRRRHRRLWRLMRRRLPGVLAAWRPHR